MNVLGQPLVILCVLVIFFGPMVRVMLSSKLHTPLSRLSWGMLALCVPLAGFLMFLLAVEYRRDTRSPTN